MSKKSEDITGKKFGKWTAIHSLPNLTKKGVQFWLCRCDCGTEKPVNKYQLRSGASKSCGYCKLKYDLNGKKFGDLFVLSQSNIKSKVGTLWKCLCKCGKLINIQSSALTKGRRTRCRGCTYEDLEGRRFGNQTVLKRCFEKKKWIVKCDCGNEVLKSANLLKITKTCGKCESSLYLGKRFGRLTAIKIHCYKNNECIFECLCDCGNKKFVSISAIKRTASCGCLKYLNLLKSAQRLIGIRIGYLTVKKILGYENGTKRILFECKCKCGKVKKISRSRIRSALSCGCFLKGSRARGESHHAAKLKNWERDSIIKLNESKLYRQKNLAQMFNVSESIISRIISNQTYSKNSPTTPKSQIPSQEQEPQLQP
jgi:hypothetical protein